MVKYRPRPGIRKIVSMKKDPVIRLAIIGPAMVSRGIRAFLNTCTTTTENSVRPLARAVRT